MPPYFRTLALRLAACLLGTMSVPERAFASPLFELVGSSVGTGGLNGRTTGASSASAYFNPALLPKAKAGLEIGTLILHDSISVTLDARDKKYDIPTEAVERLGTDLPSLPTPWLEDGCSPKTGACVTPIDPQPRQSEGSSGSTNTYQVLGLVSHLWPQYLTLGIYALVPHGSFTKAHSYFVDEREQFFTNSLHPELYGDRLTPVSLAFGAGSQVLDWLSVGLSFTLALENQADAVAYAGNSAKLEETLQLSTKVDVAASVSPHGGVLIEPNEDLDLSLTLHSPQKMVIGTAFSTYLPNGDLQRAVRPATHAWMPWVIQVGGAYDVYKTEAALLALTASMQLEWWSEYLNRQTERPLKDYEWSNIVVGTLGARYTHEKNLTTFVDGSFHPTPVPLQTGRTNYVDNDRYSFSAGATYDLPIERWKVAFRFGAQAQLHILPKRHQTKFDPTSDKFAGGKYSQLVIDEWPDNTEDIQTGEVIPEAQGLQTNNPGFPGFSSQGTLVGGAFTVSLLY